MRYQLENERMKAEIESFGAELKSLVRKADAREYMWEADPAFWGKTSPILFPFIGKLEGAQYHYNGKSYEMDKHGFARDMDFAAVQREADRIVFALESNPDTLAKFPFAFRLEAEYALEPDGISETVRVINKGDSTLHFSFGGHPAFACPLKDGAQKARTECFVKLYGTEGRGAAASTEIGVPDGLLTGNKREISLENGVFPIVEGIFDHDALCFAGEGITAAALLDRNQKEYVRLEADCPVWGIWSMPDSRAGYVCIEPWWGICDSKGYAGTLEERPYTNSVEAGASWACAYRIAAV